MPGAPPSSRHARRGMAPNLSIESQADGFSSSRCGFLSPPPLRNSGGLTPSSMSGKSPAAGQSSGTCILGSPSASLRVEGRAPRSGLTHSSTKPPKWSKLDPIIPPLLAFRGGSDSGLGGQGQEPQGERSALSARIPWAGPSDAQARERDRQLAFGGAMVTLLLGEVTSPNGGLAGDPSLLWDNCSGPGECGQAPRRIEAESIEEMREG